MSFIKLFLIHFYIIKQHIRYCSKFSHTFVAQTICMRKILFFTGFLLLLGCSKSKDDNTRGSKDPILNAKLVGEWVEIYVPGMGRSSEHFIFTDDFYFMKFRPLSTGDTVKSWRGVYTLKENDFWLSGGTHHHYQFEGEKLIISYENIDEFTYECLRKEE